MRELFVQLETFFCELGGIEHNSLQDIEQRVDLSLHREELIDDHDLLILEQTIAGFEIALLIPENIIRLRDQFFQFSEELIRVFDHSL